MADYTLKCFMESGNAYKPALMLELAGADWQPEWIDFFNGQSRTPEFRSENVMGEAPILIDHTQNELVLTQSGLILWHLADRFEQFAARNANEHREILRWILFDNHKLTSYSATGRFLSRFAKKDDDPVTEFFLARAYGAYKVLDTHLEGRDWVAADQMTIADISLCGYLFWPDHMKVSWDDYPNIKNWLERISSKPGWKRPEDLMPTGPVN